MTTKFFFGAKSCGLLYKACLKIGTPLRRRAAQTHATWLVPRCLKEDPATMSLLQRSLDPEKTLGLVDVLYTAVLDLTRWRAGRWVSLPRSSVTTYRVM